MKKMYSNYFRKRKINNHSFQLVKRESSPVKQFGSINDNRSIDNVKNSTKLINSSRRMNTSSSFINNLQLKTNASSIIQRLNLATVNRSALPANGKKAYDLLDNNRAGFLAIDKIGGDVHATQDGKKRVTSAWKYIEDEKGGRDPVLQGTIGWLGNLEDEDLGAGYNGGHLIADSLGGSGTWQNMVPQDGPENKWGEWRQYEKENKAALQNTGDPLRVNIRLQYNSDSVVPDAWESTMTDKDGTDVNWYTANFN